MIRLDDETDLQTDVVSWLKDTFKPHQLFWWHVPNGGKRSAKAGRQMKNMGARAGIPDLSFLLPPTGRAAYIELKSDGSKSRASKDQISFREVATMLGALYAECRSLSEVQGTLKGWGVTLRAGVG